LPRVFRAFYYSGKHVYYRSRSGPLQTKIVTVTSDGVILHQWGLTPPSSLANRTLQTYHHPTEPVHSCWLQEAGVAWAHSRLSVLSKHWSCKLSAAMLYWNCGEMEDWNCCTSSRFCKVIPSTKHKYISSVFKKTKLLYCTVHSMVTSEWKEITEQLCTT